MYEHKIKDFQKILIFYRIIQLIYFKFVFYFEIEMNELINFIIHITGQAQITKVYRNILLNIYKIE